ncbi:methyltransferase domain-containing protein [Yoonia sp. SS1-5]|uniref:Class I SAM-dependent methyltransferase n=1 Tax=Yoonia rhodophyticola TaxID=3137370 RepID=A0AAN0MIK8_9RHOB
MDPTHDVDNAYALTSKEEVKALYQSWAHSYDTAFGDGQGYQLPREVVLGYLAGDGCGPVLDVGAGTGLVGMHLQGAGVGPVDGVDLSEEMLRVAEMKGCYRHLTGGDITQPLQLPAAPYAGIVSAGTFTFGHVGPVALQHLLNVAAPGAVFSLSVNDAHFVADGFEAALDALADQIMDLNFRQVRIYDDRADAAHRNDMARLVLFRKR